MLPVETKLPEEDMGPPNVEVAVPYKTILPEPMILPWTANWALGVVVAPMPVLPVGSITKDGVDVPTVRSPAKVVVPMPILPPSPESTNKAGVLVSVLVPTLKSPQTSSLYLGVVVAMPRLPPNNQELPEAVVLLT